MTGTTHQDVGAYALGVLDDRAATRFEEHLVDCDECAAELESLLPIVEAMADVDPTDVTVAAPTPIGAARSARATRTPGVGRLRPLMAKHRLTDRPRAMAVAAATIGVLALGIGGVIVGAQWTGGESPGVTAQQPGLTSVPAPPVNTEPPGVGGPDAPEGEKFSATDPVTGVRADVILTGKDWGTQVSYALSRLTGPMECRLVVVRTTGATETVASWIVPREGYGTEAHPEPLLLQDSTSTKRADLALIQVQSISPTGVARTLVEIPV